MISLQLNGGDLVIGRGGFAMISGAARVKQDLSLAVSETLGVDRFHPGWGSQLPDYIGTFDDGMLSASIQAEIGRVVQNYIAIQMQQMQADRLSNLPSRFSSDEVVRGLGDIKVTQSFDTVSVQVTVNMLSGDPITVLADTSGMNP